MSDTVAVPAEARATILSRTREESIHDQGFTLDVDWWNPKIADLPGSPLSNADGAAAGRAWIDRKHLFSLADDAVEDDSGEAALRLLWPTLLWGTGDGNRNNGQRIASVAADPQRAALLLRDAARASRRGAEEAFTVLRPRRTSLIKSLGPGFFTKFLYFAGGGDPDHPCLIVDDNVLTSLWDETGRTNRWLEPKYNYGVRRYLTATAHLQAWATALSTPERTVAGDEVERWAFGR